MMKKPRSFILNEVFFILFLDEFRILFYIGTILTDLNEIRGWWKIRNLYVP